jgi:sulfopyruvate decarboxylase TPP-binding subunit
MVSVMADLQRVKTINIKLVITATHVLVIAIPAQMPMSAYLAKILKLLAKFNLSTKESALTPVLMVQLKME